MEETDIDWVYSSFNVNRAMETIFGNEKMVDDLERVFKSTIKGTDGMDTYEVIDQENVYPLTIQPAPIVREREVMRVEEKEEIIYEK